MRIIRKYSSYTETRGEIYRPADNRQKVNSWHSTASQPHAYKSYSSLLLPQICAMCVVFFIDICSLAYTQVSHVFSSIKWTGSWDGLELRWHAWVDLGLKKGNGKIFNFSDPPVQGEKIFRYFLLLKRNPLRCTLYNVIGVYYLVIIFSLLIGQCRGRPLIPVGWTNIQIICPHIWPMTNPTLLGISKYNYW